MKDIKKSVFGSFFRICVFDSPTFRTLNEPEPYLIREDGRPKDVDIIKLYLVVQLKEETLFSVMNYYGDRKMKDEEMAEEYCNKEFCSKCGLDCIERSKCHDWQDGYDMFLAGLKAGRPQWHKITDWKDNSQFPKDDFGTYLVRLYQDHYVICELDITEGYRQFYLPDNLEDVDPEDVIAWCEIPTFDKE